MQRAVAVCPVISPAAGLAAIAITDRNSVAGVVRAFSALKELARLREITLTTGVNGGVVKDMLAKARQRGYDAAKRKYTSLK